MNTRMRGRQASDGRVPVSAPRWLAQRAFRQGDIPAVRRFTRAFCARAGIGPARLADFVLAVSESAACATAVGPCTARVRLWVTGHPRVLRGPRRRPAAAGGARYPAARPGGRGGGAAPPGARRLSDHVSVASGDDGVRVLLSMTVC